MNGPRVLELVGRTCQILARYLNGGILCFIALVPGWILFHGLVDIFEDPKPLLSAGPRDLTLGVGLLVFLAALMYFLLLLAYRAFTFRGRKKDRGLLPPLAMQAFAILFSLAGAGISALGITHQDYLLVGVGLIHFLAGVGVFQLSAARRRRSARQATE
jgi:hypothetical protein